MSGWNSIHGDIKKYIASEEELWALANYVNCFPSSRQSKKYKIFPASRYGLLAVFMQLT